MSNTTYTILWQDPAGHYYAVLDCAPEELGDAWLDTDYYGPLDTREEAEEGARGDFELDARSLLKEIGNE